MISPDPKIQTKESIRKTLLGSHGKAEKVKWSGRTGGMRRKTEGAGERERE